MKTFSVDVDFLQKHTRDRGLVLLESATKENPELLMAILEAGWGDTTCLENVGIGRKFISQLRNIKLPEHATRAFQLYFRNASSELVTQHVVNSSPQDGNSSPLIEWLNQTSRETPIALLNEAKKLGADFELVFRHSVYDNSYSKSKVSEHTSLSALISRTSFLPDFDMQQYFMQQASDLLAAGKQFDKPTAGLLLTMPQKNGIAWINFFVEKQGIKPSKILQLTSRMTSADPERRALLSSFAAMEAMDDLFASAGAGFSAPAPTVSI